MLLKADGLYVFGAYRLNARERQLLRDGQTVSLPPKAFDLLVALVARAGHLVTKEELLADVWPGTFVEEANLSYTISLLRRTLGDEAERYIETVPKRGYRFREPVSEQRPPGDSGPEDHDPIDARDSSPAARNRLNRVPRSVVLALTVAVLAVLVGVLWLSRTIERVPPLTPRLTIRTQPLAILDHAAAPAFALSPDGSVLAYVAGDSDAGQLYIRHIDSLEAKPIAGAERVSSPFFSPDGEWLAFFGRGKLQKVAIRGGAPIVVCGARYGEHGASWGDDGTIVFQSGDGASRVSADGGTPKAVAAAGGEFTAFWPEMLPGSRAMVFTGGLAPNSSSTQTIGIWALSFETGEVRLLVSSASTANVSVSDVGMARYVRSGHLLYAARGSLVAVPFDIEKLELTGSPVPVIPGVMMGLPLEPGGAQFAVSHSGMLAYLAGPVLPNDRKLVWVNRDGREEALFSDAKPFESPRISPDGSRIVFTRTDERGDGDVWIYDLARRTFTRLTFDGTSPDARPLWTPDGQRVVFRSYRDGAGRSNLFWKRADGMGDVERLTSGGPAQDRSAKAFSRDGTYLAYVQREEKTGYDIHLLDMSTRSSRPLIQTRFVEGSPAISPDDRWIAYRSFESGRSEVYVRPFPDVDAGKWQVSFEGGHAPVWSGDGRELFFQNGDRMMAVAVQTGSAFRRAAPKVLFSGTYFRSRLLFPRHFDVSPDGRRFIMIREAATTIEASARDELTIVLNWFDELRRLTRAGR